MSSVFRLSGAVKRDEGVENYLNAQSDALHSSARNWFAQLKESGADVRELMHDGYAWVCIDDAAFAYVLIAREHVTVGFLHGAALEDPTRLLEGTGKRGRHVKVRPGTRIDARALTALIDAAYRDMKLRLRGD